MTGQIKTRKKRVNLHQILHGLLNQDGSAQSGNQQMKSKIYIYLKKGK